MRVYKIVRIIRPPYQYMMPEKFICDNRILVSAVVHDQMSETTYYNVGYKSTGIIVRNVQTPLFAFKTLKDARQFYKVQFSEVLHVECTIYEAEAEPYIGPAVKMIASGFLYNIPNWWERFLTGHKLPWSECMSQPTGTVLCYSITLMEECGIDE